MADVTRKRGRDLRLYMDDTGGVGEGAWVQVAKRRALSLPQSPEQVDLTAGDDTFKAFGPGDTEWHIEFDVVEDVAEATLAALLAIADTGQIRGWALTNGDITTSGTRTVLFDGFVQMAGETAERDAASMKAFRVTPAPTDNPSGWPPNRYTIP